MLTATPKQGGEVLIVETRTHRDTSPRTVPIEKVGKKYLYVLGEKFDFTGRHISDFPHYSLWDSQDVYDRVVQRRRNIKKIIGIVVANGFGNGLSDEILEQIIELIKVENVE